MNLYVESSAVLRWLLAQTGAERVRDLISGADIVVASRLTLLETRRALTRAAIPGGESAALNGQTHVAEGRWEVISIDAVFERACAAFPVEPVRSLDAIHLATALMARERYQDLAVLSTDDRIRTNAIALGFAVVP